MRTGGIFLKEVGRDRVTLHSWLCFFSGFLGVVSYGAVVKKNTYLMNFFWSLPFLVSLSLSLA